MSLKHALPASALCLLAFFILSVLFPGGNAEGRVWVAASPAETALWDPVHVSGEWGPSAWVELWEEITGRFKLVTEWGRPWANGLGVGVVSVLRCTAGTLSPDCSVTIAGAQRVNSTATVLRFSSDSAMPEVGTHDELRELIQWSGGGWGRVIGGSWKNPSELEVINSAEQGDEPAAGSSQEVHLSFTSPSAPEGWPKALRRQVSRFPDAMDASRTESFRHDRWVRFAALGLYRWQLCVHGHELLSPAAGGEHGVRVPSNSSCHPVPDHFAMVRVSSRGMRRDPTEDAVVGLPAGLPRDHQQPHPPSLRDVTVAWTTLSAMASATSPAAASGVRSRSDPVPEPSLAFRGPLGLGDRGWRVPTAGIASDSLRKGHNGTLCTWLWVADGPTGTFRTLFHKGAAKTPHRTPSAWLDRNTMRVAMRVSSVTNWDVGGESVSPIPVREWTHVCFRWANLSSPSPAASTRFPGEREPTYEMALFLNGALDTLLTVRGMVVLPNDGPIFGGKDPSYPGAHAIWLGTRLFSETLAAGAIQSLYATTHHVFPSHASRRNASFALPGGYMAAGFSQGEVRLSRAVQLVVYAWQSGHWSAIPSIATGSSGHEGALPLGTVSAPLSRAEVEDLVSRASSAWDDCQLEPRVAMDLWEEACFASGHPSGDACRRIGMAWMQPGRDSCKGDVERVTQLRRDLCPGGHHATATARWASANHEHHEEHDEDPTPPCQIRPGISRNTHWARRLFARAAQLGDADAMYLLGWVEGSLVGTGSVATSPTLLAGSGGFVRPNEIAIGWFVLASSFGSAPAWAALAERFRRGEFRDLETAVQYSAWCVSVAASQFHAKGQQPHHEVLRLTPDTVDDVEKGHSGEEDELLQLQQLRAEQGDPVAQTAMGDLYYFGARGLPRDQPLARDFFQRAVDQAHAPAMTALAGMLLKGEGGEKETERAISLYETAADKGNVAALNGLGFMYFYGSQVPENKTKALELFLRAGDAGASGDAFFNAGKCFEEGHGTNQSYERAKELYEAAAFGAGHFDAIVDLGRFHAEALASPRNLQEACNFWEAAMKQGRWGGLPRAAFGRYRARDYDGAALLYAEAWQIGGEVPAANAAYLLDRGLATWDAWVGAHEDGPVQANALVEPSLPQAVDGLRIITKGRADVSERHRFMLARVLYEYSLQHGGASSALPLADILLFGRTGESSDTARAVELYAQASAQGHPQAAFTLGYLFEVGVGPLKPNEAKALRYYHRSLQLVRTKRLGHAFPIYWAMARIHLRAWWWPSPVISDAAEELEAGAASRWFRWSVDARGHAEAVHEAYLDARSADDGDLGDDDAATETYRGEATRWQWVLAEWFRAVFGVDPRRIVMMATVAIGIGLLVVVRCCWRRRNHVT